MSNPHRRNALHLLIGESGNENSNTSKHSFFPSAVTLSSTAWGQLVVTPINGTTVTVNSMANTLLAGSPGITINSVTYTGANGASGTFSGGTGIIGFGSGVLLTSGSVNDVVGPNNSAGTGTYNRASGDSQLDTLSGGTTVDASVLTITFTPTGSQVQFSYVFASEEYNEYVGSAFNDVFGYFVNGTNQALLPSTTTPVAINHVNCGFTGTGVGANCSFFVNNDVSVSTLNTEMDGLTTVLTLTAAVTPNQQNTLKLAIADTSDALFDSAVFLAAGTFSSCGGTGQPACGTPSTPLAAVAAPTLNEWILVLLSCLLGAVALIRFRQV